MGEPTPAGSDFLLMDATNVRLALAAPDLLEALKRLLGETDDADSLEAEDQARAAIKKATGET